MGPRILIIRFSSIGDIVLTSPVMRCIKKAHPGAHITYVCKEPFRSLVSANPYVDEVLTLNTGLANLKSELKQRTFDHIFDLHNNLRSKRLAFGLSGKYSAFPKLNIEKWLLVNLRINRMPSIHIVERYLQTASSLGVAYDGAGLDYFFPADAVAPDIPFNIYVCMAIGGQHATKRLPLNKLSEIIARTNKPVVLIGGNEDHAVAEELIILHPDKKLANFCGKWNLAQSAFAVKGAEKLLTHDTGMMHIGAALGVPILSIWGNTVPVFGMYPFYGDQHQAKASAKVFEVEGLSCRPCSKIGFDKCPKGHFLCMQLQETEAIAGLLNGLPSSLER